MRTGKILLSAGTALALSFAASHAIADEAAPSQLTLQSGVSGGTWFPIGAGVMEILSNANPDLRGNAEPGGAASNLVALDTGDIELGFTMTILPALAEQGADPFPQEVTSTKGISVMFPNFTHVLVRADSDIQDIPDLEGESFASQPVGTGTQIAFADMLEAYGLSEDDLTLTRGGQGHGADQIRDRQAVGMTATTGAPGGTITELASVHDVRFLGVDDEHYEQMISINPGYVRSTLPAGTYPGQDEDVEGVGTDAILVVSEDMSEEHAYWITKTLVENVQQLNDVHAATSELTPERMSQVEGVDLHPGAQRYYEEAGLL